MAQNFNPRFPVSNHDDSREVATARRKADVEEILRQAVGRFARELQVRVPPAKRSEAQGQLLRDCLRKDNRRSATPDTLAALFTIAAQCDEPIHALSAAFFEIEVLMCNAVPVCATEASDAEDESNHPLNVAQKLYERERSEVRAVGVVEAAHQQLAKTFAVLRAFIPLTQRSVAR